ncbi:UDP-Glycosyltransferase/glycogen phosphorylase [Glarea lozoyensis ATCC 20868]|uniref:UDP-Glycosyltransferase/glycogen phosphorylase n=1 Tax=Glarea lozoyensis (strain ATCC 20868 / MF5171) TaxID=1116229 RepID=S3CMV0_GLAL2|nr:UDP-Glycosyltransferase/glycogen phosphorylase [Glarea lozoyensis ATCC 20868]EPE26539.1 UDP-Glycosyltransferase/glycogen phosphorylase [Glarea lozoyensis ATCC 20868]
MASRHGQECRTQPSVQYTRNMSEVPKNDGDLIAALYAGISAVFSDHQTAVVAVAIRDCTYLLDFSVATIELNGDLQEGKDCIADYILRELGTYGRQNMSKYIGAGVPCDLLKKSPTLGSRLWLELDIVPISIEPEAKKGKKETCFWNVKFVDEQADSMARKCILYFGPTMTAILQVGYRGIVEVDAGYKAPLLTLDNYKSTCGSHTWDAMLKFVTSLKRKGTKIAFFSSTPQGGGVALMRHALIRLARQLGVDLKWYVPKPKPGVFRITKTVHNILQGVSDKDERISSEDKKTLSDWIQDNANRYWLSEGGPLRPPEEGGADVIDDPQMPCLIPLIKNLTPNRPVLFRSHIQIRSDLISKEGTPQADTWQFLWSNIQLADMFISHPIPEFVPSNVPNAKVAYLPATTDWLDGLNKPLDEWNMGYYRNLYNQQCHTVGMTELKWPSKKYIIQIARFDPAKGIPDAIAAFGEFCHLLSKHHPTIEVPQLIICGNGSVDDPDGTKVYSQTMNNLKTNFPSLLPSVSVMRLTPNDQLLNTLLSSSHVALQLSNREGFEVKVSEAIHKGIPVIATKSGGIPLQVQHGKNGLLVEAGDSKAVAGYLLQLWTDGEMYGRMSGYARGSVSDEVGTVGNALAWFYLVDQWGNGDGVVPGGRWVNDLAREEAGVSYVEGENRLPRF